MELILGPDFAGRPTEVVGGVGGEMRFWLEPAQISLELEDGTVDVIGLNIGIAQPTVATSQIPSLLGRDILQYYRLVADGRTGEIYLEREE
jgi:hypothetical protein